MIVENITTSRQCKKSCGRAFIVNPLVIQVHFSFTGKKFPLALFVHAKIIQNFTNKKIEKCVGGAAFLSP